MSAETTVVVPMCTNADVGPVTDAGVRAQMPSIAYRGRLR